MHAESEHQVRLREHYTVAPAFQDQLEPRGAPLQHESPPGLSFRPGLVHVALEQHLEVLEQLSSSVPHTLDDSHQNIPSLPSSMSAGPPCSDWKRKEPYPEGLQRAGDIQRPMKPARTEDKVLPQCSVSDLHRWLHWLISSLHPHAI